MGVALSERQASLYAAEADSLDGLGVRWRRRADAQAYLDRLIESEWFFDRYPTFVRCTVERRGSGSAVSTCHPLGPLGAGLTPTEGVILVADGCLTQPVVLHELAHLLVPIESGHGREFVETQLALVRHEMGLFAFAGYRHALRAARIYA